MNGRTALRGLKLAAGLLLPALILTAEQVPVRHLEGRTRGFLVLRDTEDKLLASGNLMQLAAGSRVTTELEIHFRDGSVYRETTVFSQRRTFQLVTYRLIQKGPAFKRAMDLSLNASTGQVAIQYSDEDGKEKSITDRIKVPDDLANGLLPTLLCNIDPKAPKTIVSMLVATPKPRLVKLEILPSGEDSFSAGGPAEKAMRFAVKVDIGGVAGVIAPIVGKQPPDTLFWVIGGKAPGFLKSEGPLFPEGPLWRIELVSPAWQKAAAGTSK